MCLRIEAAGEFDDDIDVGSEDGVGVFAPNDGRGGPGNALAGYAAVEDVREFQSLRFGFNQNARDGAADRAKAEDGDAQRAANGGVAGNVRGVCDRRGGVLRLRHLGFL